MDFPYQCLVARSGTPSDPTAWTLFGASGSKLVVQSSNGTTSVWPQQDVQVRHEKLTFQDEEADEEQERSGKRIKLSPPKEQKTNFLSLVLSSDGQYLVGVTGEDKCLRVFQIDSQSRLHQLSGRPMSRKPSSIALTADGSTILCADKFGDVYALPLLPSPDDVQPEAPPPVIEESEEKDFTPSATVLTVHSGRNRKTLEEQLKKKAKGPLKTKDAMTFRHDLLLGHVSMLTDLASAKVDGRNYIITADRDEHIRISRGVPQAHIIEGFCFGHEEFVSRLCVTQSGLLVSGGGDAELFVWDWQNYQLVKRLPIRDVALQHLKSRPELLPSVVDDATFKTAVSGIWEAPSNNNEANEVLVACEGQPALFRFNIATGANMCNTIPLQGNPLGVAFIQTSQNSWVMIVSVDNVQKPGSTTEIRDNQGGARLQCFSRQGDRWQKDASTEEVLKPFLEEGSKVSLNAGGGPGPMGPSDDKAVRDIIYHVENLRKRPGTED